MPESWEIACDYDLCVEDAFTDLERGMPCFEETNEFGRCRLERLSCEDHYVMDIDTTPGSVCYDVFVAAGECVSRETPGD